MNVKNVSISRRAGALTGSLLALSAALPLTALAIEDAGTLAAASNYVKVAGSAAWVTGSKSAWQTEVRHTKTEAGGIEELKIDQKINDKDLLQFESRLLPGNNDYYGLVRLKIEDKATIEVGYKEFRTYYDGVGGFFPTNGAWKPLADKYLHTDRSSFWVDAKVALPDKPVFHFRYSLDRRDGQKDSTIWGDSDQTGLPLYAPYTSWSSGNRKLVASYVDLDEKQQTFEGSVMHTVGKTKLSLAVVGTFLDNLDTRHVNRYPGELQVYDPVTKKLITSVTATTVSPGTKIANHTWGWDAQGAKNHTWAFTGKFETFVNDKVSLFGGINYATTDGDVYGDRRMFLDVATATGIQSVVGGYVTTTGRPPYSYTTQSSNLSRDILTGNVGVNLKPVPGLFLTAALKAEHSSMDALNNVTYWGTYLNPATGVATANNFNGKTYNNIKEDVWVPELNARYNGIRTVSIYGSADYRHSPGDETTYGDSAGTGNVIALGTEETTKVRENHGNYKVGASWAPNPLVTLRAETFMKDHDNRFGETALTSGFYILNTKMKGAILSAALTPSSELTCTTRYTLRSGTMDVMVDRTTGSYEAGSTKVHQISEAINWTPNKDYYVALDLGYSFDTTNTTYLKSGDVTTFVGTTPTYRFANQILRNADNNYWTGSAVAGVNVDSSTSVELKYFMYHADNYQPGNVAYTLPYGMSEKNSNVSVGVKHKFSEKLAAEARVGYFKSDNPTSGGNSDYKGTLAYVSLTHAF